MKRLQKPMPEKIWEVTDSDFGMAILHLTDDNVTELNRDQPEDNQIKLKVLTEEINSLQTAMSEQDYEIMGTEGSLQVLMSSDKEKRVQPSHLDAVNLQPLIIDQFQKDGARALTVTLGSRQPTQFFEGKALKT